MILFVDYCFPLAIVIQNGTQCSEGSRMHTLKRLRYALEILHCVQDDTSGRQRIMKGIIGVILYQQVKERREKRNSRNHLFRDYGSKGRGRKAHPEFLVVWVV